MIPDRDTYLNPSQTPIPNLLQQDKQPTLNGILLESGGFSSDPQI